MSQGAVIESIPVGGFDVLNLGNSGASQGGPVLPVAQGNVLSSGGSTRSASPSSIASFSGILLAGQPLPPLSRDYGFAYAQAKPTMIRSESAAIPPSNRPFRDRELRERNIDVNFLAPPSSPDGDEDYFEAGPSARAPTGEKKKKAPGTGPNHGSHPRVCISCGATKTPYWREAWSSSVLLCNACGLRFSKFRRRCLDCSYVPRKEDKGSKSCTKCGGPWS